MPKAAPPRRHCSIAMHEAWIAVLTALVMLLSCTEEEPLRPPKELPNERIWESPHFRYHSRANDESVCEGLLANLESHFSALQQALGFPWPAGERVEYYKFLNAEDKRNNSSCSRYSASCFFADVGVQTAHPIELHELVHAYLAPLGRSHIALEEGLADALSCGQELRGKPELLPLEEVFRAGGWNGLSYQDFRQMYATSRWFVGWLVEQHGPQRFLELHRVIHPEDGLTEISVAFEELYQTELSQAWEAAFESNDPDTACLRIFECASPVLQTNELPSASCEWPVAVGRFALQKPSWLVQRSSGFGLTAAACPGTAKTPHHALLSAAHDGQQGETIAALLPAGDYFAARTERAGDASLSLYKSDLGHGASDDCSAVVPLPLDFRSNLTVALHAPQDAAWTLRVSDLHPVGRGYQLKCGEGSVAKWCKECGECTTACDTAVMAGPDPEAAGSITFELSGPAQAPRQLRLDRVH